MRGNLTSDEASEILTGPITWFS